jgi:DNA-binding NarL/FixJ family response regulator
MQILLLVSDQMMCDGLKALFSRESTGEVIGESADGSEALDLVRRLQPDVVLADMGSRAFDSMGTIRRISQEQPQTRIVVLSPYSNRAFIAHAFRAGVQGYVLRENGFSGLRQAVKTVMTGSTYLCSQATQAVLETCTESQASSTEPAEPLLSEREYVVLRMLADGRTSKEIALALHVSSKTIDACRRQLMHKLGVESVAGLVKHAIALGLTTLSV